MPSDTQLQFILSGAQTRLAEQQAVVDGSQLESIITGVKDRAVERQQAIQDSDGTTEQSADQNITQGFHNAAAACPPDRVEARKGFEDLANHYGNSTSREQRDDAILKIAKEILFKQGFQYILNAAGGIAIAGGCLILKHTTPEGECSIDGTEHDGNVIDNDDGTREFIYDTDNNGTPDTEVTIDASGKTIDEPEDIGFSDVIKNLWETVF